MSYLKGFTLIELVVTIAIIAVLSGVILFSVTQYINKGKDSNIYGNLAVLIPAGEVFYNGNGNSYNDTATNPPGASFCDPGKNSAIKNAFSQMPQNPDGGCLDGLTPGVCCHAESQAWVACAIEFTYPTMAYCVDSRGMKKEIANGECANIASANPVQCPED